MVDLMNLRDYQEIIPIVPTIDELKLALRNDKRVIEIQFAISTTIRIFGRGEYVFNTISMRHNTIDILNIVKRGEYQGIIVNGDTVFKTIGIIATN